MPTRGFPIPTWAVWFSWPRIAAAAQDFWGYEYDYRTLRFVGGRGPQITKEEADHAEFLAHSANGYFIAYGPSAIPDTFRTRLKPGACEHTGAESPHAAPDLSFVAARKKLDETAFFFPHLVSDQDGVVRIEFTMPDTLTAWRFLGFVHDRQLRSGLLQDETITAKDLMVQPNPPRFLREGDELDFIVKVTNQSGQRQAGKVQLTFAELLDWQVRRRRAWATR